MKKIFVVMSLMTSIAVCDSFDSEKAKYLDITSPYKHDMPQSDKLDILKKAEGSANILLGILPNITLNTKETIEKFCQKLEKLAKDLLSNNDQSPKTLRDIDNYTESAKFLQKTSELLDFLYKNKDFVQKIMENDPKSIIPLAIEITAMLDVLNKLISNPEDIEGPISILRDFAKESIDGTHLLSSIVSFAMNNTSSNFEQIINNPNAWITENRKYIAIR